MLFNWLFGLVSWENKSNYKINCSFLSFFLFFILGKVSYFYVHISQFSRAETQMQRGNAVAFWPLIPCTGFNIQQPRFGESLPSLLFYFDFPLCHGSSMAMA